MRTIDITDNLTIEIEALRRSQIKVLKEKGFNVSTMSMGGVVATQWDEFIDALVEIYAPKQAKAACAALDKLPNKKYRGVCLELIAETWGSKEEEKNS